jgi:rod shape-determining protein MreD
LEKVSRGYTLKIFGCLLVAAFLKTTLVQQVPQSLGEWLGHIDWLLLVVVYIGLQRDPFRALLTGTAAGIMQDIFSGGQAVGISGFAYVLAAYITYRFATFIMVDNLMVRFMAVAVASLVSTIVRLSIYKALQIELPVLAGGQTIAPAIVFGLFANLIASVLFFNPMNRIFGGKDAKLRLRRSEARRRRLS